VFQFLGYTLDVSRGCLRADDREIEVRPKSFDVLRYLVENAGRLIPKDELVSAAWPDVVVTDDALTRCISEIRAALNDHEQQIIKTVHRRGYLFAAPVSRLAVEANKAESVAALSPARLDGSVDPVATGRTNPLGSGIGRRWLVFVCAMSVLVAIAATVLHQRASGDLPLPDRPSIAVLPFANLSGDSKQDYFVDGMSEELITALSKFSQLFVIARHSAFSYRDKRPDAKQIGHDLGVRYLLQGSVRRDQARLRITAQLVDAQTGRYVWAERYDRSTTDVFAVQDELTERIVTTLVANIERVTIESARRKAPESLNAYELFLQGRELMRTATRENTLAAERLLKKATALDPGFAPPFAQLAFAQYLAVALQWDPPRRQAQLEKGFAYARRALAVAPSLPFANLVLGDLYMRAHEYDNAVLWARKAIELNPGDAESYAGLANIYTFIGRSAEAVPLMQIALRHDPVHPPLYDFYLGRAYVFSGEYEKAVAPLRSCTRSTPDFWPCPTYLSVALAHIGRREDAHIALESSRRLHAMNSIRDYVGQSDFRPDAQFDRVLDGLRKAGLPD
jgi:TolB-like protein/DNA-binding winged helix-turn-helix (wHTH) protein